jgi:hypothetical protein
MEPTSLKDLLREHIELKGFTPKKIAEAAGIPERYIEALLEGNNAALPPAPYVHGYFGKLASILNFDKDSMWRLYQKEALLARSGARDRLPNNRFAARPLSRGLIIGGSIAAIVLMYAGTAIYGIVRAPELAILVPAEEESAVAQEIIVIRGKTDPRYTVVINGAEAYVDATGIFTKEIALAEGLNTVEITATKLLGRETRRIYRIMYLPPAALDAKTDTASPKTKERATTNATTTNE